jgi:hypothetical protein
LRSPRFIGSLGTLAKVWDHRNCSHIGNLIDLLAAPVARALGAGR